MIQNTQHSNTALQMTYGVVQTSEGQDMAPLCKPYTHQSDSVSMQACQNVPRHSCTDITKLSKHWFIPSIEHICFL